MANKKTIPYGLHHLDDDDILAVENILKEGPITQGQTSFEFGQALAEYTGAKYGIALTNGTAALHLSLAALNVKPGDEVITTPLTFCATANAILYQGADVVFADVDEKTMNISPELIEQAVTDRTTAIIPVDFRGYPAPLPKIKTIADHHCLSVIEDGSHSLGSTYTVDEVINLCGNCMHADLFTTSFHPVKHITTGEGGAILTNDESLYRKISVLTKHGIDRTDRMLDEKQRIGHWFYDMVDLGYNYRLTDFQAALGLSQLKKISRYIKRRREIVNYYNDRFIELDELILPYEDKSSLSNFHLYVLQVKENERFDRYDLFNYLRKTNYLPMVHYIPVHLLSYYKTRFGFQVGDFPVAEKIYSRSISIPLYPALSDADVERVADDITSFVTSS